ncbi:hypothetical protein [Lutibacter sp.]|uniref:hypothetical protein n=1 Tax=Lutibacter sp. TaxID=1925666 RepID=UPI003567958D
MNNLKLKLVAVFMLSGLVFTSCEDSNLVEVTDLAEVVDVISDEEAIALVESDDISDEVDNIIDDFLYDDLNLSSKDEALKTDDRFGGMPDCVVKTVVIDGTIKTVTLDFGDGCELPNGNIISGKIIMSYSFDLELQIITVIQSFEGFAFNDITIVGENTIVRIKENENGNPESTKTIDMTLTWTDGEFVSRVGTKTREWIEGYDTIIWDDNVYLITGNWTNTFKDGTVCSAIITEALRREMSCRFIVSGIIEFTKGELTSSLNFGDGTCDDIAVITNSDGVETEIILKRRMH